MIHAFTSSAPNYAGKVRALAHSLEEHCPEITVHWVVADVHNQDLLDWFDDGAIDEIHFADSVADLPDPAWLFSHDIVELSTAIKAQAALSLLDRPDCDLLLYFDPDIVLFSPLDDLLDALASASLVLTPHLLEPEVDREAVLDHELCSLRHGVFNLGFFGVRDDPESRRFLEWWRERCRTFCWADWRSGVFTDQKWLNLAPVFFPDTTILRCPRFNVAPWNLNQRSLEGTFDEGFVVDGSPLGFYHFTGFDSGAHREVVEKYVPRSSAARMLLHWYVERTAFLAPPTAIPWRLGLYDNGLAIAPLERRIYRERPDLQAAFPDPFEHRKADGMSYLEWLEIHGPSEFPELARLDRPSEAAPGGRDR